ncbi:MAG: glucose dehydrogenase [Gemmatimonas sp.]|nr:glucose dehydrogenase [Gemmatimonas sp.]
MKQGWKWLAAPAAVLVASCVESAPSEPTPEPPSGVLRASEIATGLSALTHLASPPGDPRLFVAEQEGRIRIIENGQLLTTPYLDISSVVRSSGERGLLSLAFHPDYEASGYVFVNYTDLDGNTRIERYTASPDPNVADPASAKLILSVDQPFSNHNGSQIAFGPDGKLYIGMGDGGDDGDPHDHGQSPQTLLGAMLRIDVDDGDPYAIPPDNPYVDSADARPEIWAIGLRNPWRFSFDDPSGILYIADVGEGRSEEVNARPADEGGLNYGWAIMEGSLCFQPSEGCSEDGLVLPVTEYPNPAEGCAITGGHVYRGNAIPELQGHYFYADFCRGQLRSFLLTAEGAVEEETEWALGSLGNISSFGVDATGEMYILVQQGLIYRLDP